MNEATKQYECRIFKDALQFLGRKKQELINTRPALTPGDSRLDDFSQDVTAYLEDHVDGLGAEDFNPSATFQGADYTEPGLDLYDLLRHYSYDNRYWHSASVGMSKIDDLEATYTASYYSPANVVPTSPEYIMGQIDRAEADIKDFMNAPIYQS